MTAQHDYLFKFIYCHLFSSHTPCIFPKVSELHCRIRTTVIRNRKQPKFTAKINNQTTRNNNKCCTAICWTSKELQKWTSEQFLQPGKNSSSHFSFYAKMAPKSYLFKTAHWQSSGDMFRKRYFGIGECWTSGFNSLFGNENQRTILGLSHSPSLSSELSSWWQTGEDDRIVCHPAA